MGLALLTDLYELNMAASYLRRGMTGSATFSLFIRKLPPRWGFFVAAGLDSCLAYLEDLRFTDEDLDHLRGPLGFDEEAVRVLAELRFTGEVHAVPEGRLLFPDEPLLEVTAPLPEAQIVESYLLNQVTYQTAVASKAARCRIADPDATMVDFSFRRVHGGEAGIGVARSTAIAGFDATSNVEAARLLGLRATGTMAHSYIEAFGSEIDAFQAFAEDFPERVVLLVDTYDTARGVAKAIEVARDLRQRGRPILGIRLDSGDLGALAHDARSALDEAGLGDVRIFASGGLDEDVIAGLRERRAPIDAYGIGTKVGVADDAPAPDSVYKLVEYDGEPVAKLSTAKATLPGPKQVFRGADHDVIGLRNEDPPPGSEPLLAEAMSGGSRVSKDSLADATGRFERDLAALPDGVRSLDAEKFPVKQSAALSRLADDVRERIRDRELRD